MKITNPIMRLSATILALTMNFSGASASVDETELFRHKDWRVQHEYYTNSQAQACAARTVNRRGDTFDITVYDNHDMSLFIFFGTDVYLRETQRNITIDVDYSRWYFNNLNQTEGSLTFRFGPDDDVESFIKQIMRGQAVSIKDKRGGNFAVWSLRGSSAAIQKLVECWERIVPGNTTGSRM